MLLSFSNSFVNVFGNSIGYYFNSVTASEVMNKKFTSKYFPNAQIDFGPLVNIFQVNSSNDFHQRFFKDAQDNIDFQFDIKLNDTMRDEMLKGTSNCVRGRFPTELYTR